MPSVTPADVLAERRRLIMSGDADGFADLFAPDAVIEHPFEEPAGRLTGREAIRASAHQVMASPLRLEEFEVAHLYQTEDPEVVIAEMRTRWTMTSTGRSASGTSIQVLRIRDGQIVLFRDYANPRVLDEVLGDTHKESMFARVNSVETTADELAGLIAFSEERLPAASEAPGFKGFYLLADRPGGKVMTISLWDGDDPGQVEDRAAQVRAEAGSATGIAPPATDTYEVVLRA